MLTAMHLVVFTHFIDIVLVVMFLNEYLIIAISYIVTFNNSTEVFLPILAVIFNITTKI